MNLVCKHTRGIQTYMWHVDIHVVRRHTCRHTDINVVHRHTCRQVVGHKWDLTGKYEEEDDQSGLGWEREQTGEGSSGRNWGWIYSKCIA